MRSGRSARKQRNGAPTFPIQKNLLQHLHRNLLFLVRKRVYEGHVAQLIDEPRHTPCSAMYECNRFVRKNGSVAARHR
jgi:hypothetical protein